jgi:transposase
MNRNANHSMSAGQIIGTMNGLQVFGLDIAKQVFQMHTVDMRTGEIVNVPLKRAAVLEHFANHIPCMIGIEACGGANYWARELRALGHSIKLIPAASVRPFVTGNKTDATDARGIWLAIQQPGVKFVAIKTVEQQATLTLHRQREQLVKTRTAQTNALRGLLYEFGITFNKGRAALFKEIEERLERLQSQLPTMVADSLREQIERIKAIGDDIAKIEKRLGLRLSVDTNMQRVLAIPGVGTLTATAVIATMGEASAFKSGREFCAWLGLVPKQTGSGGKVRLGHISKRGDKYVRTLLIHGARAVLCRAKEPSPWLVAIKARRPTNVAIVAQAAKMARTIWAVTAKEQEYQRGHQSVRPAMA